MPKSAEEKLRNYIKLKYGKIEDGVGTPIIKYTKREISKTKCEMCGENIYNKKSFVYEPSVKYLTGSKDMVICEPCAKREHGSKNRYKWKNLIEDLGK